MAIVTMTSLICRFSCIHFLCVWLAQSSVWQYAFWQISTNERQGADKGVRGGNIAKQLKPSNMSRCIQNTKNITVKDTAYIVEREKLVRYYTFKCTDRNRQEEHIQFIVKPLQWNLVRSLVAMKWFYILKLRFIH